MNINKIDYENFRNAKIEELLGKTLDRIEVIHHEVHIYTNDNKTYILGHRDDCCESVHFIDTVGDINDLLGSPLTLAEETYDESGTEGGHQTYSYYKFATIKGYVTLSWLGESNGYYSETVNIYEIGEGLE